MGYPEPLSAREVGTDSLRGTCESEASHRSLHHRSWSTDHDLWGTGREISSKVSGVSVPEEDSVQGASALDESGSLDNDSIQGTALGLADTVNFSDSEEDSDAEVTSTDSASDVASTSFVEAMEETESGAVDQERDATPSEAGRSWPLSPTSQDVQSTAGESPGGTKTKPEPETWSRAMTFGGSSETSRYFEYEGARDFGDRACLGGPIRTLSGGWADTSNARTCNLPNPMVDSTPRSFGQFSSPKVGSFPYSSCFDYSPSLGNLFYHNEPSVGKNDESSGVSWVGPSSFSSSRLSVSGGYTAARASKYLSKGRALSWHVTSSSIFARESRGDRPSNLSRTSAKEQTSGGLPDERRHADVSREDAHTTSKQMIDQVLESNLESFDQLTLAGVPGSSLVGAVPVGTKLDSPVNPS